MSFAEYDRYDGVGLAGLIDRGEVSMGEVLEAAVDAIEKANPVLNAVVHKLYSRAQARITREPVEGPFAGVPFLLKDLVVPYQAAPFTGASRSLASYVPDYSGTLARRYEAAGLVIVGKTNLSEFGLAPATEPELFGITRNPWNPAVTAGGSSGGSGAAVAAGMVPMAHATDGGGSIRIPASVGGVFGFKPTRGRVPVGPVMGEAWFGLTVAHAITRTVRDSAGLLDISHGPEPGDPYAAPHYEGSFLEELGADPGRLWVGLSVEPLLGTEIEEVCRLAVHDAGRLLESLGHRVSYVEVPVDRQSLTEAFLVSAAAEASLMIEQSAALAGKDKPDPADYELATWVLGLVGKRLTTADLARALDEIRRAGRTMARFHQEFDVLVTSTLARSPWPHGALAPTTVERKVLEGLRRAPVGPLLMTVFHQLAQKVVAPIANTPLFNITGQPAMSMPLYWGNDGLPIGVQFSGRFGDDALLFRLASQLEAARPWFDHRPAGTASR
jgi:amidase